MSSNTIYYVYAYLRSKDSKTAKAGTPYYIGKGTGYRAYGRHRNKPTDKSRIIFLETNLTNLGANALERRMISWYGRKDLGTGILNNLTDGGDGTTGAIRTASHNKKISVANLNKPKSDKAKQNMSLNHANVSGENNPNAQHWKITSPDGVDYIHGALGLFCNQHGLNRNKVSALARGTHSPKKGIYSKWQAVLL